MKDNRDIIRELEVGDKFKYRGHTYSWFGHISTMGNNYDIVKVWNEKKQETKVKIWDTAGKVERL